MGRGRGWLSGFASLSRRNVPGVWAGAGWGIEEGIYSVSRTQSISQSLALSWRVSSDVSKGKERKGRRKGKLKSDFIEWTKRRGEGRGGEGRWWEQGISYMRPEGSDDIRGVQIMCGVRETTWAQASERARYKTDNKGSDGRRMVEEKDGVRWDVVQDVWDVLYSPALAQSLLPDKAVQLWTWGFWKERHAPRATHGCNKEPGKVPAKSQKPCPLDHQQNSACAGPSLPISMPGPQL